MFSISDEQQAMYGKPSQPAVCTEGCIYFSTFQVQKLVLSYAGHWKMISHTDVVFCLPDTYQRACLYHTQKQVSENFVQKQEEMETIARA